MADPRDLSPATVCEGLKANEILLVDVREPNEFAFERIHGALLHPLSTFEPKAIPTDPGRKIVFQCGSGKRSRTALDAFMAATRQLRRRNWVVYSKPPFGSPEHVLAYLGRYTHRVAIANSRLVSADETSVTFRWRDYRRGNAPKLMSLDPHEFIRRFLIHSLPDGFHRIRHYGFLANGCRRARLAIIRQLLAATKPEPIAATGEPSRSFPRFDPTVCPCCGGSLLVTATLPRWRIGPLRSQPDTS